MLGPICKFQYLITVYRRPEFKYLLEPMHLINDKQKHYFLEEFQIAPVRISTYVSMFGINYRFGLLVSRENQIVMMENIFCSISRIKY